MVLHRSSNRIVRRAAGAMVAVVAATGFFGVMHSASADTYTWIGTATGTQAPNSGDWSATDWATSTANPTTGPTSSDVAVFSSTGSPTVTLGSSGGATFIGTANTINLNTNNWTFNGPGVLAASTINIGAGTTTAYTETFNNSFSGTSQLVINSLGTLTNTNNTLNLYGDNSGNFTGGLLVQGTASLRIVIGTAGSIAAGSLHAMTGAGTGAITINASGSGITQQNPGVQSYWTMSNDIYANTTNQTTPFAFSFNSGSAPGATPNTITYTGAIHGKTDIIVTNDFYSGGGKGAIIFTNTATDFNGKLVINNNGTQATFAFTVGNNPANPGSVIPATTQLVFGYNNGATPITKPVGYLDLNGHDLTVASLRGDATSLGIYVPEGIINGANAQVADSTNSGGAYPASTVYYGNNGGAGGTSNTTFNTKHYSTLTIRDTTGLLQTTYNGPIVDGFGSDYSPTTGYVAGTWRGVALQLDAANKGSTTLTGVQVGSNYILNYSGPTDVRGGALYIDGYTSGGVHSGVGTYAASPITAYTPSDSSHVSIFGGNGTINGTVLIQTGAILAPLTSTPLASSPRQTDTPNTTSVLTPGTLQLNSTVTLNSGSTLQWMITDASGSQGVGYSFLDVSGSTGVTLNPGGGHINVTVNGTFANFDNTVTKSWGIANFPSLTTPGAVTSNFTLDTSFIANLGLPASASQFFLTNLAGGGLQLNFTAVLHALNWTGTTGNGGSGTWNTTFNTWNNDGVTVFSNNNSSVVFSDQTGTTASTITIAGTVAPSLVRFSNTAGHAYTLVNGSIKNTASGTTSLLVDNTGTVTLTTANTYTGGTSLSNGGTLETQITGAIGTGGLGLTPGTLLVTTNNQTFTNSVTTVGGKINTVTNATFTGAFGGAGSLTKAGNGKLTLTNTASYAGDTTISAGSLQFNAAPSIGGATSIAAGASLVVAIPTNSSYTLNGQLANDLSGDIVVATATTFQLGTGVYQGASGTGRILAQANGASINGLASLASPNQNPVTINVGIVLNSSNLPGSFVTYVGMASQTGSLHLESPISGNGSLEFSIGPQGGGSSYIYVDAANTYSGNTYVNVGGSGIIFSGIDNAFPATTVLTFGDGVINAGNTGSIDFSGYNQTVAGIATAFLAGQSADGLNNTGFNVTNLTINGTGANVFNSTIAGSINLILASTNTGTQTLSHSNTFTGSITINGGNLRVAKDSYLGDPTNAVTIGGGALETTSNVNFSSSRTFVLASTLSTLQVDDSVTSMSGALTGTGGLQKTGTGTLVLTQASTYLGSAKVVAGTVQTSDLIGDLPNGLNLAGGLVVAPTAGSDHTLITAPTNYFSFNGGKINLDKYDLVQSGYTGTSAAANAAMAYAAAVTISAGHVVQVTTGALTGQEYMNLTGLTSFDGHTVLANDLLLRYTLAGDANFSGTISLDDYLAIDAGYTEAKSGWAFGDFNHDGTVNALDYALIDANYLAQSGTLADGEIALHTAEFGGDYTNALSAILNPAAVPEPASLAVLALGGVALLKRRRKA